MKTNTIHILYTLVDCGESVSDCHTLYSTLEKAKAAMEVPDFIIASPKS